MTVPPTVYRISPSKDSTVAVEVFQGGLLNRKGKHMLAFENFSGEVQLVANDPTASQVLLTVDTASVVCRDAGLHEKKRRVIAEFAREDALKARRYPEIAYRSTSIRAKPLRGFVATGILQICGTTRELKVNMTWTPKENRDLQLDGDATISLGDFDLPKPSAMCGLVRTMDEVMVHLLLRAAPAEQKIEHL